MAAVDKIQPHWWSKSLAGIILGFTLALFCVGLFAWLGPDGLESRVKPQVNMWLVTPIWMIVLSSVFLFKTGLRAWSWLLAANIVVGGALMMVKLGVV